MKTDDLILVDYCDQPIGCADKLSVHQRGLLHRAFSVFIIADGKMLLQKRHPDKYHSGGLWTNACCSHPKVGEEVQAAARRRLEEEVGITCTLEPVGDFIYRSCFENGITEYEYDHILLGTYSGTLNPDPEEIVEMIWVSIDELVSSLQTEPERYTSWFVTAAHLVLEYISRQAV